MEIFSYLASRQLFLRLSFIEKFFFIHCCRVCNFKRCCLYLVCMNVFMWNLPCRKTHCMKNILLSLRNFFAISDLNFKYSNFFFLSSSFRFSRSTIFYCHLKYHKFKMKSSKMIMNARMWRCAWWLGVEFMNIWKYKFILII